MLAADELAGAHLHDLHAGIVILARGENEGETTAAIYLVGESTQDGGAEGTEGDDEESSEGIFPEATPDA